MPLARSWPRCAVLALLALGACNLGSAETTSGADDGARAAPAAESLATDRSAIARTLAEVTADVNRIQRATPAEQQRLLPGHERLVNGMLARFETKVRAMHVRVDPDWVSVIDSVRTDLARMPRMSGAELHAYIPAHTRRLMRIVACIDMVRQ